MGDVIYGPMPPRFGGYQRKVTFQEAVKMGFDKYATFSGRSSRSEFWWWVLFCMIASIAATILDGILGTTIHSNNNPQDTGIIASLVSLGLLIPSLAISWRRIHDIGRTGTWYLLMLIPIALNSFTLIKIVLGIMDSQFDFTTTNFEQTIGAYAGLILITSTISLAISILFLVWYCTPSQMHDNRYGEIPNWVDIK